MRIVESPLAGIFVLEPKVFEDSRGWFLESYNERAFAELTGLAPSFVQDNHAGSEQGVLRGLHYQFAGTQGKLVRATAGQVFDVAVDLRKESLTFGRWYGVDLSAGNRRQIWIPGGFAHGYYVTSDFAEVQYKTTAFYEPAGEGAIRWDDPDIAIDWPLSGEPLLSAKDRDAALLRDQDL